MTIPRADLEKAFPGAVRLVRHFDAQQRQVDTNTAVIATNVEATGSLNDATVITLSPNDSFNNERVLAVDGAFLFIVDNGAGNTVEIGLLYPITLNGGFACTLNLSADTNLDVPSSGKLLTTTYLSDGPYANDAAAAAGGVAVGGVYRVSGGTLAWRQA